MISIVNLQLAKLTSFEKLTEPDIHKQLIKSTIYPIDQCHEQPSEALTSIHFLEYAMIYWVYAKTENGEKVQKR